VFLPALLAYYAAAVGRLRLHRRLAFAAADWCPRLYGWLVTPPFTGVHVFTDWLAFAAADWCFRLHCWPIMPLLMGIFTFIVSCLKLLLWLVFSLPLMDDFVPTSATSVVTKGKTRKLSHH
jgi:HGWP repeat.